jgi:hypothetical protein
VSRFSQFLVCAVCAAWLYKYCYSDVTSYFISVLFPFHFFDDCQRYRYCLYARLHKCANKCKRTVSRASSRREPRRGAIVRTVLCGAGAEVSIVNRNIAYSTVQKQITVGPPARRPPPAPAPAAPGGLVPRVGVSKSGNSSRFFPDARFGTDRGPTVHTVRALDQQCACHEQCAAHYSIGLAWRRRPEEQVVPNFGGESVVCASANER